MGGGRIDTSPKVGYRSNQIDVQIFMGVIKTLRRRNKYRNNQMREKAGNSKLELFCGANKSSVVVKEVLAFMRNASFAAKMQLEVITHLLG